MKSPLLKTMTRIGVTRWIDLNFSIDYFISSTIVDLYCYCLHFVIDEVYLDRNAFRVPTTPTVIYPLVYNFTCREKAIRGLVPNGIYFILQGFSLSFV